jgi:hypothetical protein
MASRSASWGRMGPQRRPSRATSGSIGSSRAASTPAHGPASKRPQSKIRNWQSSMQASMVSNRLAPPPPKSPWPITPRPASRLLFSSSSSPSPPW